jgi:hypothetical protein
LFDLLWLGMAKLLLLFDQTFVVVKKVISLLLLVTPHKILIYSHSQHNFGSDVCEEGAGGIMKGNSTPPRPT